MIYKCYFSSAGSPESGLTPVWDTFRLVSDGTEVTPQPAISEIGGGWYKTADYTPAAPIVGVIDGGATLDDADRYLAVDITPQDAHLDAAVSSRSSSAQLSAVDGKIDALQAGTWQNYYNDETYNSVGYQIVTGALISGTADDTKSPGIELVLAPDGTNVLDVNFRFPLSLSRPSELTVRARYDGTGGPAASRYADIYFWNFALATPAWVLITDAGNRIAQGESLSTRTYVVADDMKEPTTGEVRVRYVSSRANAADRLYLDVHLIVGAVAGTTAGDLSEAVWTHNTESRALDGAHVTAGWYLSHMTTDIGDVTNVAGSVVTMSGTRFSDTVGLYDNRRVQFHKNGEPIYEVRRIVSQAAGGELTLDREPILVESSGWHGYVLHEMDTDVSGLAKPGDEMALSSGAIASLWSAIVDTGISAADAVKIILAVSDGNVTVTDTSTSYVITFHDRSGSALRTHTIDKTTTARTGS